MDAPEHRLLVVIIEIVQSIKDDDGVDLTEVSMIHVALFHPHYRMVVAKSLGRAVHVVLHQLDATHVMKHRWRGPVSGPPHLFVQTVGRQQPSKKAPLSAP